MDYTGKKMDNSFELSWKMFALKQGYLINFHRGLLKAPKMQYFVLTANGLVWFEGRPYHDTKPLCFLPYEHLSSIKLDHIDLNGCKLSCMQLTSKAMPASLTLGFNCAEDRDEWMVIMMKAFSEALLTTRVFNSKTTEEITTSGGKPATTAEDRLERTVSTGSYAQSLRRKRRKGDKGSIRKSKSYDSLTLHDVTNTRAYSFSNKRASENAFIPEERTAPLQETRKRKSEPNIHVISHFPTAWKTDDINKGKEQPFATSCSFEHRDSLTIQAEKQIKGKRDSSQHKTSVFAKLRSKLENPVRHVH